jgi:hypothetical protein
MDKKISQTMFGCDIDEFRKSVEESITFKLAGPALSAISQLSDAQEEIELGLNERARQTINRAKWIISTYLDTVNQSKDKQTD